MQTEANKAWATKDPKVAGWLRNFKLTPQQLGTLEQDMNQTSSPAQGAQKWIQANPKVIQAWFNG
ncbi:hypothetical protein D2Q93_13940 [Alicyclobacillaceae bacterium I2511]|nr:hypothetical protein D2Q93_13940 [Alicyclobacillaceae bacterium I2511]